MKPTLSDSEIGRLQEIIIEQLDVKREHLTLDAKFMEDLGADSLDMVEIAMTTEEEFGLNAPDEEMERVQTVGDLYEVVGRLCESATSKQGA